MGIKCPKCHFDNPSDSKFCKECGTQIIPSEEIPVSPTKTLVTPIQELTRGTTFAGRYQIIEELGRGGMGVVYKAQDTKLKRTVALKFLPPELTHISEVKERFMREAQAAAALDHPNICTVHEFDEAEEKTFISMAYIEGQSLKKKIESGPIEFNEALRIATQVAEGLQEAHKKGVVHRDIKSANIMVTERDQAKIMDFGLARVAGGTLVTKEPTIMGTVAYMSPEQARGEAVDHRTDIWSLGVVLYEMISGQLPFQGDRETSVMYSIVHEAPKPLKALQSDIPEELEHVVGKALAKNLDDRYQNIVDLIDDLYSISKGFMPPKIKAAIRRARLSKIKRAYFYSAIAVLFVLLVAAGFYLFFARGKHIDSIAVLPFENMSKDPDIEYLSDGITETLINKLSQLPGLKKVIARGSVFRYKGKEIDPQAVGQELRVDTVLMSQMSQRGDELSISVELVKVQDNSHIWGKKFTQRLEDIFSIEEEIAKEITMALQMKLTGEEKEALVRRYTEDREAYNLYLKGRYYWNKRTEEAFQKGLEYFQLAIEKDPTYALAYAGIADCYNLLQVYGYLSPKEALPKARAAAEKTLEIDSSLAEAHTSLAWVRWSYDLDSSAGEKEFKRALELNPSYATGHHWYSVYLTTMGRHAESLAEIKRAQEVDPLSLMINTDLGTILFYGRQYDLAIEQYHKTLDMDKDFVVCYWRLAEIYAQREMYNEALAATQKMKELLGDKDPLVLGAIGYIYALLGKRDEAKKVLNELSELSKHRYISSLRIALIYMGLGQKDQAFKWLEKAYEERDFWMTFIKVAPYFDSLRSDPRFKILLKKMNLE
jgi:serine/threonine-protein kinase